MEDIKFRTKGACMFCGQVRELTLTDWKDSRYMSERFIEEVEGSGHEPCDHLASCLCNCGASFNYAGKFENRMCTYADVEYLLDEKPEVIETARRASDLVLNGECDKITFKINGADSSTTFTVEGTKKRCALHEGCINETDEVRICR